MEGSSGCGGTVALTVHGSPPAVLGALHMHTESRSSLTSSTSDYRDRCHRADSEYYYGTTLGPALGLLSRPGPRLRAAEGPGDSLARLGESPGPAPAAT